MYSNNRRAGSCRYGGLLSPLVGIRHLVIALLLIASVPNAFAQTANERQKLLDRIDVLEKRVEELESSAVLSEPETMVKKVEVYVDDNGIEYDEPKPGTQKVVTYRRERVYRRQTISEKIEEALDDAASKSVALGVDAAIVMQYANQTTGASTPSDGNVYQLASTDLTFSAGLAQNTIFFADVVGLSGTPGDADPLSAINGYGARLGVQNDISLREAWLLTELFSQQLTLTAGRLDLTAYFDNNTVANDETTQFLADALVNNPALGLSENGAGLAAIYDPKNGFSARFGYQQSNSMATNLSDSLFYLAELDYQFNPFGTGEGNYRVWYRKDNSDTGIPGFNENRSGYGVSLDQKFGAALTVFARYGSAEQQLGDDKYMSAGLQFAGAQVFNPEDYWGLGYASSDIANDDEDWLLEGYYNLRLTEKLQLSFHMAYVTQEPAGGPKVSFVAPGLRLQAGF